MMMITRQNVHLKFEEKYTRKEFFFGQKRNLKPDTTPMSKIVLKISDDDPSKCDKLSFIISSTNYNIIK